MSGTLPGLRERRRTQTIAEIKAAALGELAATGPDGLSLRAVARSVGVSVQALYHYFDSRDALVAALITDAFDALTAAVTGAADTARTPQQRIVSAGLAYREWALANRSAFLLALGAPLTDSATPEGGPSREAAARMGRAFQAAVFADWTGPQLDAVPLTGEPPGLHAELSRWQPHWGLPPGAAALFTVGWATLHGVVVLELLGHLPWIGGAGEDMCRAALLRYADQVTTARGTAAGPEARSEG